MRDKYFNRLGLMRMPLAERGMVATLWSIGDTIVAPWEDIDAIMGNGWMPVADRLASTGVIRFERSNNWIHLSICHPNQDEREKGKKYARRRRENQSKIYNQKV